jgi:hypothetical protein
MKPPLRGKYLVTEHAVELRRIISALPIVAVVRGILRSRGVFATVRAPAAGRSRRERCVTSRLRR